MTKGDELTKVTKGDVPKLSQITKSIISGGDFVKALLGEIENMILVGNEQTAQREKSMESSLTKMDEIYSAIKQPSRILKIPRVLDNAKIGEPVDTGKPAEIEEPIDIPLVCSCGKPWNEGARFCSRCGAERPVVEVIDRIICSNGHENTPGAKFCRICGERIV